MGCVDPDFPGRDLFDGGKIDPSGFLVLCLFCFVCLAEGKQMELNSNWPMGGVSFYATGLSFPLTYSGFSPCISYPLLCNKSPPHATADALDIWCLTLVLRVGNLSAVSFAGVV